MMLIRSFATSTALAVACLGGGCAGGSSTASLGLPSVAELPSLPKMPELPAARGHASTSPVDTYALVARGATSCWFGAGGALKKSYIFYADAEPPSAGGTAEIALQERGDPASGTARGAKVYRINFAREGDGTRIDHTNHKLPDPLVSAIENDVQRFARGELACASSGASAPQAAPPPAIAAPAGAQPKRKVVAAGK